MSFGKKDELADCGDFILEWESKGEVQELLVLKRELALLGMMQIQMSFHLGIFQFKLFASN